MVIRNHKLGQILRNVVFLCLWFSCPGLHLSQLLPPEFAEHMQEIAGPPILTPFVLWNNAFGCAEHPPFLEHLLPAEHGTNILQLLGPPPLQPTTNLWWVRPLSLPPLFWLTSSLRGAAKRDDDYNGIAFTTLQRVDPSHPALMNHFDNGTSPSSPGIGKNVTMNRLRTTRKSRHLWRLPVLPRKLQAGMVLHRLWLPARHGIVFLKRGQQGVRRFKALPSVVLPAVDL